MKTYYVASTANTRGRRVVARNARAAKTTYKNITGITAGTAREVIGVTR